MRVYENPDKETVRIVREGLAQKDGYCPCRLTKTPETKCMCKEFREQDSGLCHCGLYYKEQ